MTPKSCCSVIVDGVWGGISVSQAYTSRIETHPPAPQHSFIHASTNPHVYICTCPPTHPLLRQQELLQRRPGRLRQIARQRWVALEIYEASATTNVSQVSRGRGGRHMHTHADMRELLCPPPTTVHTHT